MDVVAASLGDQLIVVAVSGGLALTVGGLVAYLWDELRRRREGDLAAAESFYRTYGEFFVTWKLWDAHVRGETRARDPASLKSPQAPAREVGLLSPTDVQWRLLERAASAEAGFEAILVKLAAERPLSERDIKLLGAFRESYQRLREEIRDNQRLAWRASPRVDRDGSADLKEFRQYIAFKSLSEHIAVRLQARPRLRRATSDQAIHALREITKRAQFKEEWWIIAEEELGGRKPIGGP